MIRPAKKEDISAVSEIYERIIDEDEAGNTSVGWLRGVYPTEIDAQEAFEKGELFVAEQDGIIVGSAIINKNQVECYKGAGWRCSCDDDQVMVLHTLAISPRFFRKGIGNEFIKFYENYALENNCRELRIDTQVKNTAAQAFYKKCGFAEIEVRDCTFNGISSVHLLLLEKTL